MDKTIDMDDLLDELEEKTSCLTKLHKNKEVQKTEKEEDIIAIKAADASDNDEEVLKKLKKELEFEDEDEKIKMDYVEKQKISNDEEVSECYHLYNEIEEMNNRINAEKDFIVLYKNKTTCELSDLNSKPSDSTEKGTEASKLVNLVKDARIETNDVVYNMFQDQIILNDELDESSNVIQADDHRMLLEQNLINSKVNQLDENSQESQTFLIDNKSVEHQENNLIGNEKKIIIHNESERINKFEKLPSNCLTNESKFSLSCVDSSGNFAFTNNNLNEMESTIMLKDTTADAPFIMNSSSSSFAESSKNFAFEKNNLVADSESTITLKNVVNETSVAVGLTAISVNNDESDSIYLLKNADNTHKDVEINDNSNKNHKIDNYMDSIASTSDNAKVVDKTTNYNINDDSNINAIRDNTDLDTNINVVEDGNSNLSLKSNVDDIKANLESEEVQTALSAAEAPKDEKTEIGAKPAETTEYLPSTSTSANSNMEMMIAKSVVASTHDISMAHDEFKLTESELQIGKSKPYWIPDADCAACMLCSNRFTIVNRRHHCRCCGRVLCGGCCPHRRILPFQLTEEPQVEPRKQRICSPCNKILDRIELYEKFMNKHGNSSQNNLSEVCNTNGNKSVKPSQSVASIPTRKKSVLKVRTSTVDSLSGAPLSTVYASEIVSNSPLLTPAISTTSSEAEGYLASGVSSVLVSPTAHSGVSSFLSDTSHASHLQQLKRSVTFRDGVNPGDDLSEAAMNAASAQAPNSDLKKALKRLSRKTMEKRAEEEFVNLLSRCAHIFRVRNCEAELTSAGITDTWAEIASGRDAVTVAIRRNLHAIIQIIELRTHSSDDEMKKVLSVSTRGLASLGVDELVIVIECGANTFDLSASTSAHDNPNDTSTVQKANTANNEANDDNSKTEQVVGQNCRHLLELLALIERIFSTCTSPPNSHPDSLPANRLELNDRLGIRQCFRRMRRLYEIYGGQLCGVEASCIYLARPGGQSFGSILTPNAPFFVGVLFQKNEFIWANCVPNRVLYAIGKQFSGYPTVIVNAKNRPCVYSAASANGSVLKVLNDFRRFTFRIAKIDGSIASLMDAETQILIPKTARDQLKTLIETNKNMLGWALDFNAFADSHLTCLEESGENSAHSEDSALKTHIFSKHGITRKVTGATFVIFDGALRTSSYSTDEHRRRTFAVNVVEDGVIVRMSPEMMSAFVKKCAVAEDFELDSTQMRLRVRFIDDSSLLLRSFFSPERRTDVLLSEDVLTTESDAPNPIGLLLSPIDGLNLTSKYQYGLVTGRALRSLCYFVNSSEWALRLAAVINLEPGKFPTGVQSKFFETCEQLTTYISFTLDPFLSSLVYANQRSICVRIHISEELATYDTAKWSGLEDQHYAWTSKFDDLVIPLLYGLCPIIVVSGCTLNVELHLEIVSIRPLHFCCITPSLRTPKYTTILSSASSCQQQPLAQQLSPPTTTAQGGDIVEPPPIPEANNADNITGGDDIYVDSNCN